MAQKIDAIDQIRAKFDAPLEPPATRRVVVWHDADGSFEDDFESLSGSGLGTKRPVALARTDKGSAFELKRRIYRLEPDADFLIYERAQTVTIVPAPEIGTEAVDATDLDHEAEASEGCVIRDTVAYKGLTPGRTYTLTGTLMDKETGKPVKSGGKDVTATVAFAPEKAEGSVKVEFELDATELAGRSLVAFEYLRKDGEDVAAHADITDAGQTVAVAKPAAPVKAAMPTTGDILPMVPAAAATLGSGLLAAVALLIRRRDPGKRAAHAARPEDDGDGFGWEDLDGNSAA